MSFLDTLTDKGYQLLDGGTDSLSRRIDNELNSDFLPSPSSPQQAARETPVVKTADNQAGRAKFAGTGGSVMGNISTPMLAIGGVTIVGLIAYMAFK